MSQVLDDLVALLSLEQIEENLFRGSSQDLGFRQLFGGQVLGQCVSAASQTVEEARHVHSMHGYFLRPGDASLPVVYRALKAAAVHDSRTIEVAQGQKKSRIVAWTYLNMRQQQAWRNSRRGESAPS